jgi:hypothetical protein
MVENFEAIAKMATKAAKRGAAWAAHLVVHSIVTPPRDVTISLAVELPTDGWIARMAAVRHKLRQPSSLKLTV